MSEYLTKAQAAAHLGVSSKTIERHRASGKLEFIERLNASNRTEIAYPIVALDALKVKNGVVHTPSLRGDHSFAREARDMASHAQRKAEFADMAAAAEWGAKFESMAHRIPENVILDTKDISFSEPELSVDVSTVVSPDQSQAIKILRAIVDSVAVRLAANRAEPEPPAIPVDRKLTLSIKEAAEYAGVSQRFLKDLVRANAIVSIKDGRRTRISRGALEAYFSAF